MLSVLLHGNITHILVSNIQVNLFSQLRLSFTIEKYYGFYKFSLIYLVSGLGGNMLGGYFKQDDITVGASASLFGVFGAYGCYFMYNWDTFGPGRNLNLILYLFFVVISLELPIHLQSVDMAGHIGGFYVGLVLGFFLLPREEDTETWNYIIILNGIALLSYFITMIWLLGTLEIQNCCYSCEPKLYK